MPSERSVVCTISEHARLKESDAWETLPFVGIQRSPAPSIPSLEMRNCQCGSTLCKEVSL